MDRIQLQDQNSQDLIVQEGESFNFTATFKDVQSTPVQLTKAQILTLTLTLYTGTTVINSRNAQDIKDTNGGSLTDAGALTLKLLAVDQAIVSTTLEAGEVEEHIARIEWTWNDGSARKGIAEYVFLVEKLASPTVPS